MKRTTILLLLIVTLTASAFAQQQPAPKSDDRELAMLSAILPACGQPPKISKEPFETGLAPGFRSSIVTVESDDPYCAGQFAFVQKGQRMFLGMPWPLASYQGSTEEKIRKFAWERLRASVTVNVSKERTVDGLLPVVILQKTEYGAIPLEGAVDDQGAMFFPGAFHGSVEELVAARQKTIAKVAAPSKGKAEASIHVVEFSDYQCPSCKYAAEYVPALLEKYGAKVRYSRVDLPLMTIHPWAFPASMYGRAVWRQKPEAFWTYKAAVYENQADLNMFILEDFARAFASKHGLDMKKFDADLESESLRKELLAGVGAASAIGITGTPTFLVNGRMVTGGANGETLEKYLDGLVAQFK